MAATQEPPHKVALSWEIERLAALDDCQKVIAALRTALRALEWYADESHWKDDDWNVRGVVQPPEYGQPGKKARNAIKRVERQLR